MATSKEILNQLYDSNLESQKASLEQDYNKSVADLNEQQIKNQQQTTANLNRTAVENQKAQRNYNEVKNAYGMTSGAMAQARMASDNQLQQDMTALRANQQANDAAIERQRGLLQQNFQAAIREAQASNNAARAEKLYDLAREEEKALAAARASSGGSYGGGYNPGTSQNPVLDLDSIFNNDSEKSKKTESAASTSSSYGKGIAAALNDAFGTKGTAPVSSSNKITSFSGRSGKF